MDLERLSFRVSARRWSKMEDCGFERSPGLEDCGGLVLCGYDRRFVKSLGITLKL